MSTAYYVHCRTCNVTVVGAWINHEETAHAVIANRAYYVELARLWQKPPLGLDFDLGRGSLKVGYQEGRFDLDSFLVHAEHELVVRDEYGHDHDQCSERVECVLCKALDYCRLPPGHDGPHGPPGAAKAALHAEAAFILEQEGWLAVRAAHDTGGSRFRRFGERYQAWQEKVSAYRAEHPDEWPVPEDNS